MTLDRLGAPSPDDKVDLFHKAALVEFVADALARRASVPRGEVAGWIMDRLGITTRPLIDRVADWQPPSPRTAELCDATLAHLVVTFRRTGTPRSWERELVLYVIVGGTPVRALSTLALSGDDLPADVRAAALSSGEREVVLPLWPLPAR